MTRTRFGLVASLALVASSFVSLTSASAAHGPLERRNGGYVVTPAMMQAIDMIVQEEMKMRHRRR